MKRYAILYLATLIVMIPIDFLFLGRVAKSFFTSQVGDMLGEIKLAPAILFYLLYVVGILIFVSGSPDATWQSTLLYGALFGFFCYATFELTSLSLLRHWTWPVVVVDVSWGTFVTAVSSTLGLIDRQLDRAEDLDPSLRAKRSNPAGHKQKVWIRFVAALLAMTSRRVTSAAARSGCTASAISSPADRSSWPRRR